MFLKPNKGDIGPSLAIIIALIILLVSIAIAYMFLKDSVDPLLSSKMGSLFQKAKFE